MSFSEFDWEPIARGAEVVHNVDGQVLILRSIRSEFELVKVVPLDVELCWFFGLFRAEGSKTAKFGFELANKSRVLLRRAIEWLVSIGIERDRMRLYVLHGRRSASEALSYYSPLGVEMLPRAMRHKDPSKQHDIGAQLILRDSSTFIAVLKRALDTNHPAMLCRWSRWRELRRAMLIGFLDGDGTVTLSTTDSIRAFCGCADEAEAVHDLMSDLGCTPKTSRVGECHVVGISATPFVAVELLVDGAFLGSMSRVRLFHIAQRLHTIRATPAARRWGYLDSAGRPTPKLVDARERLATLDAEWAIVKAKFPTPASTKMRAKGVLFET